MPKVKESGLELPPGKLVFRSVDILHDLSGPFEHVISAFNSAEQFAEQRYGSGCTGFRLEQDAGRNSIQSWLEFKSPMTAAEQAHLKARAAANTAEEDKNKAARYKLWLELNKEFSTSNGD